MLKADHRLFIGIFSISFAMLMLQVLLTRVFSVTMYYHFAFLVVTIAMFGLTLGAVIIHGLRRRLKEESLNKYLSLSALGTGWLSFFAMLAHLSIPIAPSDSAAGIFGVVTLLVMLIAAFTSGGARVCICLTRFPKITARLYAADLFGAALGALSVLYLLWKFNGPALILFVLLLSGLAALAFAGSRRHFSGTSSCSTVALATLLILIEILTPIEHSLFRLIWVKGARETAPLFERWNSFSRVAVTEYSSLPFGWGLSDTYSRDARIEQLYITIDSAASTPITRFKGTFDDLAHLKADVVNIVHYLKNSADVFIVGAGGGRDILTALMFNQRSIKGIEINPQIVEALKGHFNDFAGNILNHPSVSVEIDEARSYITRDPKTYDIIQISLVDTFAASASGAFVLTENSLYTVEAWKIFLSHLSARGIFSISRWWNSNDRAEAYRTITLASTALRAAGVASPENNLIVVVNSSPLYRAASKLGIVTILASREPFSAQIIETLRQICTKLNFDLLYDPVSGGTPEIADLIHSSPDKLSDRFDMQLNPPTDETPFFFHQTRARDLLNRATNNASTKITRFLIMLVLLSIPITYLCLVKPLQRYESGVSRESGAQMPLLIYFAAIGCSFMLIEVAQMQWFSSFLGHPTYGITVVLCTLLVSTGIGSFISASTPSKREHIALAGTAVVTILIGLITPYASELFRNSAILARITLAVTLLVPLGLALGFGFPLGMRIVQRRNNGCAALYWGINGAASVCAGAAAVVIAIMFSIPSAYWSGVFCYVGAYLCIRKCLKGL